MQIMQLNDNMCSLIYYIAGYSFNYVLHTLDINESTELKIKNLLRSKLCVSLSDAVREKLPCERVLSRQRVSGALYQQNSV